MTYEQWISNKLSVSNPWNQCAEWTTEMQSAFPELSRVRGQVVLSNGLFRDHWWLVDPSGKEVDPTAMQFDSDYFGHAKVIAYLPRDESEPEPTGRFDGSSPSNSGCQHSPNSIAIVTTGFLGKPKDWQIRFVRKHLGKLVCFRCGEFVGEEFRSNADHVTATTVTERLRELGKL